MKIVILFLIMCLTLEANFMPIYMATSEPLATNDNAGACIIVGLVVGIFVSVVLVVSMHFDEIINEIKYVFKR